MSQNGDPNTRLGFEYWDWFNKIQRYSFWRGDEDEKGAVISMPDDYGAWIKQHKAAEVVDVMQGIINSLKSEVKALNRRLAIRSIEGAKNQDDSQEESKR